MCWQFIEFEDRRVGEEVDLVQARNVGHHGAAADVKEDAVGVQHVVTDPHGVRIGEYRVPADDGAAVHALEPVFDTLAVVEHDLVLAGLDFRHVHADLAGADAVVGAAARQVRGMRGGHQRLGRDAPGVDARAADQFAFDDRDALPGFRQPPRQRRARLARTDDDRVEMFCHLTAVSRYSVSTWPVTATMTSPPTIATASSSSAMGRSRPAAAASRLRAW